MTRLFLSESRPHSCFQPNTKSRPELEQGAMDKTKLICMSSPSCETSNDKFLCAGDIQVYSLRNLSDFRKTLRVLQPLWIKIHLFVWACVCLYVCTRTFVCLHECLHDWLIDVCLVGMCGCCGCILSLCASMWCNFACLLAWLFVCCCSCVSASLYVHISHICSTYTSVYHALSFKKEGHYLQGLWGRKTCRSPLCRSDVLPFEQFCIRGEKQLVVASNTWFAVLFSRLKLAVFAHNCTVSKRVADSSLVAFCSSCWLNLQICPCSWVSLL